METREEAQPLDSLLGVGRDDLKNVEIDGPLVGFYRRVVLHDTQQHVL
jgi:hypothetical protein